MAEPNEAADATAPEKLAKLAGSHGELKSGTGMLSGVVAWSLALLALLGVIGFHFPAYLSTPEVRSHYDVTTLRYLMFGAMVVAGGISVTNAVLGRTRWLAVATFALLVVNL